jgi:hypothetical protein
VTNADRLAHLLAERAVVRAHLMRNTVHLATAEDYAAGDAEGHDIKIAEPG